LGRRDEAGLELRDKLVFLWQGLLLNKDEFFLDTQRLLNSINGHNLFESGFPYLDLGLAVGVIH
jgi:hypothetical protein